MSPDDVDDPNREQFSVVGFRDDGTHFYIERWLDAKTAVTAAKRATALAHLNVGGVFKIIITDGGDNTVFCWEAGKGVTFPPLQ